MPSMDEPTRSMPRWLPTVALSLVLLVAAGLRLYRLPELPLGLHYDEAANGILAGEIARGVKLPVFIPSYTGKEVLFFYWTALWMKLFGETSLALRLSAALAGLATVAATFWAVRELLHGRRDADWVALLTAAFLATSFWHVILSRYGFRAVTQPLLQALTAAALWRGLRLSRPLPARGRGKVPWLLLAGLLCGLTAYTYLAARAFPIPLAAALITLLVADCGHRRVRLGQIALFVVVATLTLAPLTRYWLTHPGSFLTRTQQVAAEGWAEAWAGFRECLMMFFLRGDPYIRFNLPHRPLFDPVTAVLFVLGIVVLLASRLLHGSAGRRVSERITSPCPPAPLSPCLLAACFFLLVGLLVMLLPSALATGEITPSNLRAAGLLPFVYVFPALGLSKVTSVISSLRPLALRRLLVATVCCSLFVFLLLANATAYFRDWAPSAALYYAADGDLADIAAYLNQTDLTAAVPYVASIHYRHPTLAFLAADYDKIRWLTDGRTLAFPAEEDALLIFPRSASEDLAWVQSVLPDGSLVAAPAGPDGEPAFRVYRASSADDLAPTHPLTADLAHAVILLGYDVVGEPRSGGSAEVAVWWHVLGVPDRGDGSTELAEVYGPVARLTDPWGFVWGEAQPFHYPSEQWTPGEVIVDHLSIPVTPGAPPGDYLVRFSLYSPSADRLLPVLDDAGRYAGTYAELPVRLARATKPPAPADLGIRTRLDARADGLTLLGVNLDTASVRPGEPLHLTLFWRADEPSLPDYDVTLDLGDAILYTGAPVHGTYPTSDWSSGEVVADRYGLRLPRDMPPGDRSLQLQVSDHSLTLGTVTVQATDRTFEVPPISHPLAANLGNQVELLGYDLSAETVKRGDRLTLTLYWQALDEMDESYTVFTHLVASDGSMIGQRDNPPVGGTYPTNLWLTGEIVADSYEIAIPADTAPGEHRLEVGMYIAETGDRLPVLGSFDDAVLLQTITIAE
jgi:4-amino-4-deoxy-L-arabinose transferase-like glycosyltransferase